MLQTEFYEFKVCLEGIAVPFHQAEISASVDGPARARIWVTPVDHARFVYPRTLAHVFWKRDGAWRCIFEGEVTGRAFVKRENQRSVAFDCAGLESYWMQAYRFFFDVEREKPIEGQSRAMAFAADSIIGDTRVPVDDFLPSAFLGPEKRDTSDAASSRSGSGLQGLMAASRPGCIAARAAAMCSNAARVRRPTHGRALSQHPRGIPRPTRDPATHVQSQP